MIRRNDNPYAEQCEHRGISGTKAAVQLVTDIMQRQYMLAWLEVAERDERLAASNKQDEIAERGVAAAEAAAKSSAASVRAAAFAAVVSFFALVVAIAAYMKQ
jgi:hypothetical protein